MGRAVLVVGASVVVHAAAFLTPRAHATAIAGRDVPAIEVQVEPAETNQANEAPDPPEATPLVNRAIETPLAARTHPPLPRIFDAVPSLAAAPTGSPEPSVAPPAVASTVPVAVEPFPRFTLAIGTSSDADRSVRTTVANGTVANAAEKARAGGDETPLPEPAVDVPARLVHGDFPAYPPAARADGVEADVELELVVSRSGAVESVRALRRDGHGLDEAAIAAARLFRFSPAFKDGRPVRVRLSWTVQFRLT